MSDDMISNLIDAVFFIALICFIMGSRRRRQKNDIDDAYSVKMAEWRMNLLFLLDEKTFNALDNCGFRELCDPDSKKSVRDFGDVLVNAAIHELKLVDKVKDPAFATDVSTCRKIHEWIKEHTRFVSPYKECSYIDNKINYLRKHGAFEGVRNGN